MRDLRTKEEKDADERVLILLKDYVDFEKRRDNRGNEEMCRAMERAQESIKLGIRLRSAAPWMHGGLAPLQELIERIHEFGGCGDHSCMIRRPEGMGTNGSCRCRSKISREQFSYLTSLFRLMWTAFSEEPMERNDG